MIQTSFRRRSSEGPRTGAPKRAPLRLQASALEQTGKCVPVVHELRPGRQAWWLGSERWCPHLAFWGFPWPLSRWDSDVHLIDTLICCASFSPVNTTLVMFLFDTSVYSHVLDEPNSLQMHLFWSSWPGATVHHNVSTLQGQLHHDWDWTSERTTHDRGACLPNTLHRSSITPYIFIGSTSS